MTARVRLFILLARPAVVVLLGLFAATGVAEGGGGENPAALARALTVVVGYLLFSVAVNDLADQAIDMVNLPTDTRRPLVSGGTTRTEFVAVAVTAAVVALVVSATIGLTALVVVTAGIALSAGYSLRPIRIADRGAVASLLLPAGYVAVPFLVGVLSVRPDLHRGDLALLAGLYVAFIGRIVLKDFRDVRGDALFGKRTFLVRYGRGPTCALSAACWIAGTVTLTAVRHPSPALATGYIACLVTALALLRRLAADRGARCDEFTISAVAIVGRGMILLIIGHLSITDAGWSTPAIAAFMAAVVAATMGQAATMARRGPRLRQRVPEAWTAGAQRIAADREPPVRALADDRRDAGLVSRS